VAPPLTHDLELWGARTGNCLRAAIALAEAGIAHTIRRVDLRQGEHRGAEHLARNPMGKVPVLTGHAFGRPLNLSQSNAILLFADQVAPARLLPGGEDPRRSVALERFFFFVTDVIALNGAAFMMQRAGQAEGASLLTDQSIANLALAEAFAAEGPYIAGDTFSLADIAAFTIITAVANHLAWGELPNLDAWRRRIAARPGVQRGWTAFDAPPPSVEAV
jgi:GST-like protein